METTDEGGRPIMDVIGMGNPCVDLLARVNEIPVAGESASLFETSVQGGGKVATALITLGRLGARCGIVGAVGDDANGAFCIRDFARHGVDTSHLTVEKNADTPFAIVLADDKCHERSILYRRGHAGLDGVRNDYDYLKTARILHLETANPWDFEAAQYAKSQGICVAFDADHYDTKKDELTPLIDVFIGSAHYYRTLFSSGELKDNMMALRKRGPSVVVFTFGAQGCAVLDDDGFSIVPAYPVSVVDTTGAGDVFHGAFLYGMLQNWTSVQCAKFASAVSAIKCTKAGGRAGIPTRKMVDEFMKNGVFDDRGELAQRVAQYQQMGVVG